MHKSALLLPLLFFLSACNEKKETEHYSSGHKKRETCYTGEHKTMETSWYHNGQIQYIEKYNSEGLLDGERLAWDSSGTTEQIVYLCRGTQDSLVTLQKQIKSMTTMDKEWGTDSSRHIVINWYPNGKMQSRREQINAGHTTGLKRSLSQTWDADGHLKNRLDSYYTNGEPDSTVSVSWFANGQQENAHTTYFGKNPGETNIGKRDSLIHLAESQTH